MRRHIAYLLTLLRRERQSKRGNHCKYGDHRETVDGAFGILQLRCVDCGAHRALGWITVGQWLNRKRHAWGQDA